MFKLFKNTFVIVTLTLLTQLGGLAWAVALLFKRRMLVVITTYIALSVSALWVAPMFGRVPLSCFSNTSLQVQSKLYCALNRQYVTPELKSALTDLANKMEAKYPQTTTLILDANFPFITGFPLLPHLSHKDGTKADIAFYYQNSAKDYLPKATRSPIGYFAFEQGPTHCPDTFPTLRWDMAWVQKFWPDHQLDPERMTAALQFLNKDTRIKKIFLEPHLTKRFGVQSPKIRFQGCRAARHDDHIHVQL